jgi:uncharacterized membrane protein
MRKMADRAPEEFTELTAMMGVLGNPLHQKMTAAHIGRILDLAVQHDTNEHDLKKRQQELDSTHGHYERYFRLVYFVLFVGLLVFIVFVFRQQPAVLVPILTGVGGVVTGFLGGVGYAKSQPAGKRKSE